MDKIIFRADAGQNIGYGHFIRSLALADMLKNDFDVAFATVNPTEYQITEMAKVCRSINLDRETHLADFLSLLKGNEIVVLDNYFFTTNYQRAIKDKGCILVCVDPLHDKHFVADLIIVQGNVSQSLYSTESYTRFCIGYDWLLLRQPFIEAFEKNIHRKYSSLFHKVTVGFGGTDMYNLTEKTLQVLLNQKCIQTIDIIAGDASQKINHFISSKEIHFHRNISASQIAQLFSSCDLAILPTSTICLEALVCRTKIAAGFYVDNQAEFYQYALKTNLIYGMGNFLHESYFSKLNQLFCATPLTGLSLFSARLSDLKERYISVFKILKL
ncbi:MAG: UDP-2,4-diacetamido-2,4,6-trideoxy-beta-L-altropyranose hydrolase [Bacteroidales bacterium]|jgi:UDP-2,4-diacetamido-2,4,6-trideoxy-beta-L-altropyranose hydrolase|nr:UDP-2,4-diacetamido-2,4,6-trideoxy-beta-L-altropyranose hydrolase [Bacteroidales bacterium]